MAGAPTPQAARANPSMFVGILMVAPASPKYSRPVRSTLRHLVNGDALKRPEEAGGEAQEILRNAQRLHESLSRLPSAGCASDRCLVIGSYGAEVPYLCAQLGYRDVTCLMPCGAADRGSERDENEPMRRVRSHPDGDRRFEYTLVEHDLERGAWPIADGQFSLALFWGCLERLQNDPEFALFELNRVCLPGATVSLVAENAISFEATQSLLRGEPAPLRLNWPGIEGHWRRYTPPEVGELLGGTGWRVNELTTIVADPNHYWKWWKRMLFKRWVADLRRGFGLAEPYWNAFVLAHASKVGPPTRSYPRWLYRGEKIRQLKIEMLEMLAEQTPAAAMSA